MDNSSYLSQEKFNELKKELVDLQTIERKKVAEQLEYAKSLGDLSENAEYHEARDKQADIEDRIKELQDILKNAVIISEKKNKDGLVVMGSKVEVKKSSGDPREFIIVGSEEADMTLNKISHHSPIGAALMGKKKGDKIEVTTPKGDVVYTLLDVK